MDIVHDDLKKEFYVIVEGVRAYAQYEVTGGIFDVLSTQVPKEIGGRGIAGALMKACYDYARDKNLACAGTCSYAAAYLKRHPEYGAK